MTVIDDLGESAVFKPREELITVKHWCRPDLNTYTQEGKNNVSFGKDKTEGTGWQKKELTFYKY